MRRSTILLVALFAAVPLLALLAGTSNMATVSISESTTLNTPFTFSPAGFDVHDGTSDTFIATVPAGQQFVDPTHTYPKIDVFHSQPFFVEPDGEYAATPPEEYLDAIGTIVVDGTVYYVHRFLYGIDVGARTSGNTNLPGDTSSDLSPLWGLIYTPTSFPAYAYTHEFLLDDPTWVGASTRGRLAGHINTGTSPWTCTWGSRAAITSGLVQIDYRIGQNPPPGPGTMTYQAAIQHLSTNQGNSPVYVYPRFSLASRPSWLTTPYSFNATLAGEDAIVSVNPAGSQAGFANIYKLAVYDRMGSITNTLQQELAASQIQAAPSTLEPLVTAQKSPAADVRSTTSDYSTTITLTGGVQLAVTPFPTVTTTGTSAPVGTIATNLTRPASAISIVDADTPSAFLNYQSAVSVEAGANMQPVTTISQQNMNVYWDYMFWCANPWIGNYEDRMSGNQDITIPYRLDIQNTYAIQRVITETYVLTTASLSMARADGTPIDPATLTDYQLNSIIRDPTRDVIETDVTRTFFDWAAWWADAGSVWATIGTIVLVLVIVLVVLAVFGKLGGLLSFLRGLAGRGGTTTAPRVRRSWSIGRGGIKYSET